MTWQMVDEGWGRKAVDFATLAEPTASREYVAVHQRQISAPAGAILIFDAMVYHRTGRNHSSQVHHLWHTAQHARKSLGFRQIAAVQCGQLHCHLSAVNGFGQGLPDRAHANNTYPHHPTLHGAHATNVRRTPPDRSGRR